jgi:hypothetical protein
VSGHFGRAGRRGFAVGGGYLLVAAGLAVLGVSGALSGLRVAHSFAFHPGLQDALNEIDNVLAVAGAVLVVATLTAVGLVKVGGFRSPRVAQVDSWSSREFTDLGRRRRSRVRSVLVAVFAGGIPVVASAGVCLAVLTTSIGTEVSSGPNRPIVAALDRLAPGGELVVGFSYAMPMVEDAVSLPLVSRIEAAAGARGVGSHVLRLDLGSLSSSAGQYDILGVGVSEPAGSPLAWSAAQGCGDISAAVDRAAGIPAGSSVSIDGSPVRVVAVTSGLSATNRIGVVMDQAAMATCLEQDPSAPVQAVVLDTSAAQARLILAAADRGAEPAVVVSRARYLANSEKFWTSNVKPITNILALVSGLVALIAMAGAVNGRLLRNRREYASKLASGVSIGVLRSTELLRAAKDGLVASIIGSILGLVVVPLTNMTEPGFDAGVSEKDILVGCAVGLVGCLGGALLRTARLDRTVDVAESTRI